MSLMDQLEQLEKDIIEMRKLESDYKQKRTLSYVLLSLSEVKSSITNLYKGVHRSGEISESLLNETLSDLDQFVTLLYTV